MDRPLILRRPLRPFIDAMMPEPNQPLEDHSPGTDEPDDLVRRVERLRPRVHRAQVDADRDAEEGQQGRQGLVRPVPADALAGEDAEEDHAGGHEKNEGDAGGEGVDDGGPVAVAGRVAVLRGARGVCE